MTLGAITYVKEGIIIATESRLETNLFKTDGTVEKFTGTDFANKTFILKGKNIGVAVTGNFTVDGETALEYIRKFESTLDTDDNILTISRKFYDYTRKEDRRREANFYFAGYLKGEPHIFLVNYTVIHRVNKREDELSWNSTLIGDDNLCKSLYAMLNGSNYCFDTMPIAQAADFSKFIVNTGIELQKHRETPKTCGGPIDVLLVQEDNIYFLEHKLIPAATKGVEETYSSTDHSFKATSSDKPTHSEKISIAEARDLALQEYKEAKGQEFNVKKKSLPANDPMIRR